MKKVNFSIVILIFTTLLSVLSSCKEGNSLEAIVEKEEGQFYVENRENKESAIENIKAFKGGPVDFTETAKKVLDGVVHIRSTQTRSNNSTNIAPRDLPDIFKDFFGDRFQSPDNLPQQPLHGSGSGVVIDVKGHIVTNNHVINNATELEVTLHNNETFKAVVIGADPTTDLALLQIQAENLKALSFVDSDDVEIGEWVLAVGNPYSLYSTVTAGIVSAKGRNININQEKFAIESFIQTDAAINPGNSGGALVDLEGKIVGINTAIATSTGSYTGYGFAIPSNIVTKVVSDLLKYGSVQRGMLGVTIVTMNGNLAKEKDIDFIKGVWVENVGEDSAAEKAGIKPGDVIVKVNGTNVITSPKLQEIIARHRPGDKLSIVVDRKGKEKEFQVTLANVKGTTEITKSENVEMLNFLGADFETLDKKTANKLQIDGGVRITNLYPGLLRQYTQMRSGFIITHVDGKKVTNIKEFVASLENKKGGVMLEGLYEDVPGKQYYAFGLNS
ncbi:Do family serine endopeptidase [Arenibacter sp. F26102]|uniref:Do family serine endopeptidase n=1 Tax=Arenibacter sp. F26102 TaxID=2926416 RepID=UPI001FF3F2AA|nr:Do family serine endopeptidase [Arenibacter sp. F26102]MCK0145382.1 Do family serine endopeptidase [Arenibacter sp. F26102]